MPSISDAKVLIIAMDGFEQSELLQPRSELLDSGAHVDVASAKLGEIQGTQRDVKAATISVDRIFDEVGVDQYDALLIPGGVINPDAMRTNEKAVALVRDFFAAGKPVAAICHGPWMLVEADVIDGRTVTGWPSIRTDLRNAGATVVDREVVVDGNLITSRQPEDLPAFTEALIARIEGRYVEVEPA